jgi:hypothetical protein
MFAGGLAGGEAGGLPGQAGEAVRVLELIDGTSGSRIELEGNRLPVTHVQGVLHVLDSGES